MKCPTCQQEVVEPPPGESLPPAFPFCSDRCRLIDLGRWLDGKYQIPVEEPGEAEDENENEEE